MFKVYKEISWYFKENKKFYIFYLIAALISNIICIFPPKIIGQVIDTVSSGKGSMNYLIKNILILFIIALIAYCCGAIWHTMLFSSSLKLHYQLHKKLMNKLLSEGPVFYEKFTSGDLMARITDDTGNINSLAGFGIMCLADGILLPICVITIMAVNISWKLTVIALIPFVLMFIIALKFDKFLWTFYDKVQQAFSGLNDVVVENVEGVRVVRSFLMERSEKMKFHKAAERIYDKNMNLVKVQAFIYPITTTVKLLSYVISLIYGYQLLKINAITTGDLLSFFIYLNFLVWPMFAFSENISVSSIAGASIERINEILNYKTDVKDKENATDCGVINNITFKNYSFQYPKGEKPALKNLNFEINKGDYLGIAGVTGSGKTTIINQLLRFYPTDSGLLINNKDIRDYTIASIRENFAYVSQENIIFSKTIRENILAVNENATNEELMEAVYIADLEKDLKQLKDGLDTLTGEKGVALSGGQKQRISIARALISKPEILILDDALSAVDAATERNILNRLREKRKGRTTIVIAHRLSAIKEADNIIVLKDGEISEQGTHNELVKNGDWYFEQYKLQQMEEEIEEYE